MIHFPQFMIISNMPDYKSNTDKYNTSINILGGISDIESFFQSINLYFNEDNRLKKAIRSKNQLNLRTERSRTRVERAIRKDVLIFQNQDHEYLIEGLFRENIPAKDRMIFLFWQLSMVNRLFHEISNGVYFPIYYSGRASIKKDDIIGYLKDLLHSEEINAKWSESTISTLSTKYLNLLTKLELVSPGKIKNYNPVHLSTEAQVVFLYFALLSNPNSSNLLNNDFTKLSFISDDIVNRLKKLSLKGFFNMNYNGETLNIELIHSYKEISHVLYQ